MSITCEATVQLLPNERILMQSGSNELTLTTHRLRYERRRLAEGEMKSIMLEELCSCGYVKTGHLWLVVLGAVMCVLGYATRSEGLTQSSGSLIMLVGAVCILVFFLSRRHVLSFASAGHRIEVMTQGMSTEQVAEFLDATEAAKNDRRLAITAGVMRTSASTYHE